MRFATKHNVMGCDAYVSGRGSSQELALYLSWHQATLAPARDSSRVTAYALG
jgi:hypothetical protein